MGHRPADVEPAAEKLSRPQELVQRAKQLSQLSQFQFKGTSIPTPNLPATPSAIPNLSPSVISNFPPVAIPNLMPAPLPALPPVAITTTTPAAMPSLVPAGVPMLSITQTPAAPLRETESAPAFTIAPPVARPAIPANPDPFVSGTMSIVSKAPAPRPPFPVSQESSGPRLAEPSITPSSPAPPRSSLFIGPSAATIPVKTTQQKIDEFYGVKQLGNEVFFTSKFESARQVLVAGDFNNWSPMVTPMHRNGRPGEWTMKLPAVAGVIATDW